MSSLTAHDFACAMQDHWTKLKAEGGLGNISSPKLMSLWTAMGQTYLSAIEATSPHSTDPERHLWRILRPETGTAKTQGARIFSAMIAKRNRELPPEGMKGGRVGILIVTRLTEEADRLADEINGTLNTFYIKAPNVPFLPAAVARHSRSQVTPGEARKADVLVLTHASYCRALDRLEQDDGDRWENMIEWEGGTRRLTIIDETITSLIETYSINIESLKKVLAYIPEHLRPTYAPQVTTLEDLLRALRRMREVRESLGGVKANDTVVWDQARRLGFTADKQERLTLEGNMSGLRAELMKLDTMVGRDRGRGVSEMVPLAKLADETLQAVEMFVNRWAAYHHHYIHGDTLNQTRLIFPTNIPAPVVLDATASESVLWHLLGKDRVKIVDIPRGSRSYRNVTLHVAKAEGLGLTTMSRRDTAQDRITRLVGSLGQKRPHEHLLYKGPQGVIPPQTLLVLHQDAKPIAEALRQPWLSTAHYGRIDGRNDWRDHSRVVILGLDYRDRAWVNNLFLALGDHTGNEPRIGMEVAQADEVYREMDRRQLTVSVVQALNRIRCRHVIDAEGNCEPCEAFLFLPDNATGRGILRGIEREMPGIVVREWDFQLDHPSRSIRKGSGHHRLLEFMRAAPVGEVNLKVWAESVGLSGKALKHMRHTLNDPKHDLTKSLAEIGVAYSVIGAGRGAKSLLVKRPLSQAA